MNSIEIFTGCGGLALGLARAGFSHQMVMELDTHAFSTLLENQRAHCPHFAEWNIVNEDVSKADFSSIGKDIHLLAGGPPCQPFSIGGRHFGPEDPRNLWPSVLRSVNILKPKAFLFENVLGLLRPIWGNYLTYLKLSLCWPDLVAQNDEKWEDHYARLVRHSGARPPSQPEYRVTFRAIDMADYGVPQRRNRAIALGIRTDVTTEWTFPEPTHSREALYWDQDVTGHYWMRHGIPKLSRADRSPPQAIVNAGSHPAGRRSWLTVRDAMSDLPEPSPEAEPVQGHRLHLGARVYSRHTGSEWDLPAKALKAGSHGVPGGENTLRLPANGIRYFTLREMARLQGFPDEVQVASGWKYPVQQLGNAVPVQIGELFGRSIMQILKRTNRAVLDHAA